MKFAVKVTAKPIFSHIVSLIKKNFSYYSKNPLKKSKISS